MDADRDLEIFKAQLQAELDKARLSLQQQIEADTHRAKAEIDAHYAHWKLGVERETATHLTMFKAIVDFALAAIRGLIIVNGGAIIALLALLGHLWDQDAASAQAVIRAIRPALYCFVAGTGGGVLTAALAYLSQVLFQELGSRRWLGEVFRVPALVVAMGSLVAFTLGAIWAVNAFTLPR